MNLYWLNVTKCKSIYGRQMNSLCVCARLENMQNIKTCQAFLKSCIKSNLRCYYCISESAQSCPF